MSICNIDIRNATDFLQHKWRIILEISFDEAIATSHCIWLKTCIRLIKSENNNSFDNKKRMTSQALAWKLQTHA